MLVENARPDEEQEEHSDNQSHDGSDDEKIQEQVPLEAALQNQSSSFNMNQKMHEKRRHSSLQQYNKFKRRKWIIASKATVIKLDSIWCNDHYMYFTICAKECRLGMTVCLSNLLFMRSCMPHSVFSPCVPHLRSGLGHFGEGQRAMLSYLSWCGVTCYHDLVPSASLMWVCTRWVGAKCVSLCLWLSASVQYDACQAACLVCASNANAW